MTRGRLKFWGWGREDVVLSADEITRLEGAYAKRFGLSGYDVTPTPRAEDIELRAPRISVPGALSDLCTTDHHERLVHSYGKSFFDSVRAFARDFANPPDVIAFPRTEADVVSVLDWCDSIDAVAIPWGGGSSVVGGVEPPRTDRPVVTIDLSPSGSGGWSLCASAISTGVPLGMPWLRGWACGWSPSACPPRPGLPPSRRP